MGKLIPSLQADLKARRERDKEKEIRRKKKEIESRGQKYMGDDDDLLLDDDAPPSDIEGEEPEEDNSIPNPVADMMFKKFMGYKNDGDMDDIPDSVVFRDYHIFLYMLGRGLLSDYKL